MQFTLHQVAQILGGTIEGDPNQSVSTISNIEEAGPGSITFLSNPKYEPFIYKTGATAVIVNEDFESKNDLKTTLIRVKNAYTSFTALLEEYQRIISFQKTGLEDPVFVAKTATYGKNVYLGAFSYLGEHVQIGNNCKIYPQVYLGDNVKVGDNTIIYPGVKIYANCEVGNHCTLQSGAVIGSDGFGFAPQEDGTYKSIPQIGNVILKDHVDIGANTTIDCATFESTIIHSGVKIDNLVQVAHNVEIDENTVIASQTGISGSAKIGKQVILAGQVGIVGHLKVGDNVIIAAQSGISKNVPEKSTYMGSPAYDKGAYMKSLVIYRKLPELMKRIEQLEEKILDLQT
jgi:UDP-3-O-[3-hydroxymyristoyl] glucosamine N-acyltransferase